jgi:cytochrome c oxidase subunit II
MTSGRHLLQRSGAVALVLLPLMLLSAACSGNPQDTLTRNGDVSAHITDLFMPVFWVAVVIFFLVEGALVYAIIRYRRRGNETALPKQLHGNTALEITWTIIPAVVLGIIAVPTVGGIRFLADVPSNALEINVTGQQWWWRFEYANEGFETADELVIPVGRPVHVNLRSNDVIHSFWVPQLAGKMDTVPGQTNSMWFNAKRPGLYSGQCTEFCAESHAKMKFQVNALPPAEYDAWVRKQQTNPPVPTSGLAAQGYQFFMQGQCIACHAIRGTPAQGNFGPNLTWFAMRDRFAGAWLDNTPENVALWLKDPPAIKPGSKMPNYNLTDEQINQLVAYLESLK